MMVVGLAKGSPVAFTGRHCRARAVEFFGAGDGNRTRDLELGVLLLLPLSYARLRISRVSAEPRAPIRR
jgi:hypothetical protein